MKKVYLIGTIGGSYRAQNIIKILADNNYSLSYTPNKTFTINLGPIIAKYLISILFLICDLPSRIIRIINSDIVVILPMNFGMIAMTELLISKLFGKKIIVDFYISSFDSAVNDRKTKKKESIKAFLDLTKDRLLMKLGSVIIFLNKSESQYYQDVVGLNVDDFRIKILPLCVDHKIFSEDEFKSKGFIKNDKLTLCWWGTYIPLHGLENIIESMKYIKDLPIELIIFGDNDAKSHPYRELAKKNGVEEKITFNHEKTFSNGLLSPFLLNNCHLGLGSFGSSSKAKTVLVNKLVDCLALGIPCLTAKTKACEEFFNENSGVIFCKTDPMSISEEIIKIYDNSEKLSLQSKNAYQAYLKYFTPEKFSQGLLEIL